MLRRLFGSKSSSSSSSSAGVGGAGAGDDAADSSAPRNPRRLLEANHHSCGLCVRVEAKRRRASDGKWVRRQAHARWSSQAVREEIARWLEAEVARQQARSVQTLRSLGVGSFFDEWAEAPEFNVFDMDDVGDFDMSEEPNPDANAGVDADEGLDEGEEVVPDDEAPAGAGDDVDDDDRFNYFAVFFNAPSFAYAMRDSPPHKRWCVFFEKASCNTIKPVLENEFPINVQMSQYNGPSQAVIYTHDAETTEQLACFGWDIRRLDHSKLLCCMGEMAITQTTSECDITPHCVIKVCPRTSEEIKEAEEEMTRLRAGGKPPDDGLVKYEAMVRWLEEGGGKFDYVERENAEVVGSLDLGGMIVTEDLEADTDVMTIPEAFIITEDLCRQSDVCQTIENSPAHVRSQHTWMAAFLLQEKYNPQSEWAPYLRLLRVPSEYSSMPIFFNQAERAELTGSYALTMVDERIESLRNEYADLCRHVPDFVRFTLDEFVWARLVVITRIFGVTINGHKTSGLVPLADFIRHGKTSCKWAYDDAKGAFVITTKEKIEKGTQLLLNYGKKSNARFFVNYGFTLLDNPDEEARLVADGRMASVGHVEHDNNKRLSRKQISSVDTRTLNQFRKEVMSHRERQSGFFSNMFNNPNNDSTHKMISIENERLALQLLRARIEETLRAFPTTLEEDLLAMNDPQIWATKSRNIRNAIVQRVGEKSVLHGWLDAVDRAGPFLDEAEVMMANNQCLRPLLRRLTWVGSDCPYIGEVLPTLLAHARAIVYRWMCECVEEGRQMVPGEPILASVQRYVQGLGYPACGWTEEEMLRAQREEWLEWVSRGRPQFTVAPRECAMEDAGEENDEEAEYKSDEDEEEEEDQVEPLVVHGTGQVTGHGTDENNNEAGSPASGAAPVGASGTAHPAADEVETPTEVEVEVEEEAVAEAAPALPASASATVARNDDSGGPATTARPEHLYDPNWITDDDRARLEYLDDFNEDFVGVHGREGNLFRSAALRGNVELMEFLDSVGVDVNAPTAGYYQTQNIFDDILGRVGQGAMSDSQMMSIIWLVSRGATPSNGFDKMWSEHEGNNDLHQAVAIGIASRDELINSTTRELCRVTGMAKDVAGLCGQYLYAALEVPPEPEETQCEDVFQVADDEASDGGGAGDA